MQPTPSKPAVPAATSMPSAPWSAADSIGYAAWARLVEPGLALSAPQGASGIGMPGVTAIHDRQRSFLNGLSVAQPGFGSAWADDLRVFRMARPHAMAITRSLWPLTAARLAASARSPEDFAPIAETMAAPLLLDDSAPAVAVPADGGRAPSASPANRVWAAPARGQVAIRRRAAQAAPTPMLSISAPPVTTVLPAVAMQAASLSRVVDESSAAATSADGDAPRASGVRHATAGAPLGEPSDATAAGPPAAAVAQRALPGHGAAVDLAWPHESPPSARPGEIVAVGVARHAATPPVWRKPAAEPSAASPSTFAPSESVRTSSAPMAAPMHASGAMRVPSMPPAAGAAPTPAASPAGVAPITQHLQSAESPAVPGTAAPSGPGDAMASGSGSQRIAARLLTAWPAIARTPASFSSPVPIGTSAPSPAAVGTSAASILVAPSLVATAVRRMPSASANEPDRGGRLAPTTGVGQQPPASPGSPDRLLPPKLDRADAPVLRSPIADDESGVAAAAPTPEFQRQAQRMIIVAPWVAAGQPAALASTHRPVALSRPEELGSAAAPGEARIGATDRAAAAEAPLLRVAPGRTPELAPTASGFPSALHVDERTSAAATSLQDTRVAGPGAPAAPLPSTVGWAEAIDRAPTLAAAGAGANSGVGPPSAPPASMPLTSPMRAAASIEGALAAGTALSRSVSLPPGSGKSPPPPPEGFESTRGRPFVDSRAPGIGIAASLSPAHAGAAQRSAAFAAPASLALSMRGSAAIGVLQRFASAAAGAASPTIGYGPAGGTPSIALASAGGAALSEAMALRFARSGADIVLPAMVGRAAAYGSAELIDRQAAAAGLNGDTGDNDRGVGDDNAGPGNDAPGNDGSGRGSYAGGAAPAHAVYTDALVVHPSSMASAVSRHATGATLLHRSAAAAGAPFVAARAAAGGIGAASGSMAADGAWRAPRTADAASAPYELPGPAAAPAAPVATTATAAQPGGAAVDMDELVERAWRGVMARLAVERERRGYMRWA